MDNKMLLAIVIIAVLALIGRLIINKQKKGDNINWTKLIFIFLSVIVFVGAFVVVNPHRLIQDYKGIVSISEATTECIAGRKADKDINRFAGPSDDMGVLYYALQVKDLTPTGYYRQKKSFETKPEVERKVNESEAEKEVITRKTNRFPITRNPGDNIDSYLPIYLAHLANKGSVLVAIEEQDAKEGELPIAMMRNTDEKLAAIASEADSTAIRDYYFLAFDEDRYSQNQTNYYIYKGIAGLIGAIVVALVYLIMGKLK